MGISSSTGVLPLASNFLVPNGTFLVSLLAFAILVWIFGKYLIPPINKAMTDRQEAIRKEFAELEQAEADARQAEADYKEQLNNAKHEAARIREEAREQGAQIVQEARDKAQVEADRIVEHAHTQIEADRKAAFASLRRDVGSLATTLAGRIVGESMGDDERQGRVVERFLADLEEAH
jgi:F-type H+-transporting ATPase subunit b